MALHGDTAIIGATYVDSGGAAYVYKLSPTTVRLEAENMQLDTYRFESLDFTSNCALINLKGPGLTGSATTLSTTGASETTGWKDRPIAASNPPIANKAQ